DYFGSTAGRSSARPTYVPARDLGVIAAFYTPVPSRRRVSNFDRFIRPIAASGAACVVMECAFRDRPHELAPTVTVARVRSGSLLWQKERLLNLAARELPRRVTKVAWLDADTQFDEPSWMVETSRALDAHPV